MLSKLYLALLLLTAGVSCHPTGDNSLFLALQSRDCSGGNGKICCVGGLTLCTQACLQQKGEYAAGCDANDDCICGGQ
ncbi:hypothetical protein LY78DRAFT_411952 [Colletotrichum sublineola]|nr:hypothetical protein LY78DRAFT_411952 [Colletotrichum sublineola]